MFGEVIAGAIAEAISGYVMEQSGIGGRLRA
jgi:hypothetical protein